LQKNCRSCSERWLFVRVSNSANKYCHEGAAAAAAATVTAGVDGKLFGCGLPIATRRQKTQMLAASWRSYKIHELAESGRPANDVEMRTLRF